MVIPAFLLAVMLSARTLRSRAEVPNPEILINRQPVTRARRLADPMVSFPVAVSAPLVAWQAIRISALGWEEGQSRNGEFLQIVLSAGSGIQGGEQGNVVVQVASGFLAASDVLWWPAWLAALVSVSCTAAVRVRSRRWMPRASNMIPAETVALAGGGLTIFA